MRKVVLTMKEEYVYQQIKNYVHQGGNFKALCLRLGCSERTVRRKIAGYKREGRAFFRHKNHDNKPATTIPEDKRKELINLYNTLYFDANFTHFHLLLNRTKSEFRHLSLSTIRNIMKENDILSPLAFRNTEKALRMKDKLEAKENNQEELVKMEEPAISIAPHPRREKSKYAGELIYQDGSIHPWFNSVYTTLHAAIDDATGTLVGARFEEQETLKGHYHVLAQTLKNHGIPNKLGVDGRTVFEYKRKGLTSLEQDAATQFGYACKTLGIEIRSTTSAQAQGKIERLFGTLQSRLIVELRLQGVTTIEQANEFLKSYIPKHNQEFAAHLKSIPSAYEKQLSDEEINLILVVISKRVVDGGNCISYDKKYYRFLDSHGNHIPLAPKQKVLVIRALDSQLFASCKDRLFALQAIPDHKKISYDLDFALKKPKTPKPYIPPFMHPWRKKEFEAFAKDYRLSKYSFEELMCSTENIYSLENSWF